MALHHQDHEFYSVHELISRVLDRMTILKKVLLGLHFVDCIDRIQGYHQSK